MNQTATEKPGCTLEDLLWDQEQFNVSLLEMFTQYKRKLEAEDKIKYDKETERIVFNTIKILIHETKIKKCKVFVEDYEQSLRMLIAFENNDFTAHKRRLYEIMPKIQDLSISHEGRDFRWNLTTNEFLDASTFVDEFTYFLTYSEK